MSQSSMPPAPTKGSSNTPMILGTVLMLALIAGLLYWKLGSKEPKPDPEPPPVVEEKKPEVKFEAPPPPPPSEEEIEEAEKKQQVKPTRARASGPAGCGGACTGKVTPAISSALTSKARLAKGCYERALRQNAMLQGRMMVRVKISPGGSPCSVGVTQNSVGDPSVTTCVQQKFRSGVFPKPQGGCVEVNVPIKFEAGK